MGVANMRRVLSVEDDRDVPAQIVLTLQTVNNVQRQDGSQ
jgi:hypothetical protein